MVAVLKTAEVKASIGSNPIISVQICAQYVSGVTSFDASCTRQDMTNPEVESDCAALTCSNIKETLVKNQSISL